MPALISNSCLWAFLLLPANNLSASFLTVLKNSSFIIAHSLFLSHQEESNELFFLWVQAESAVAYMLQALRSINSLIHELSFSLPAAISTQSSSCHLVKKTPWLIHSFNETMLFN